MSGYDYIIVGAGSAGCVLAYRLSENPKNRILLLEAGPSDLNPLIHIPKGYGKIIMDKDLTWTYPVDPEGSRRGEAWLRGKTLGGSSSINGLLYNRGTPSAYDRIAALGLAEYGWDKMVECFRAIEHHELGPTQTRGAAGPLNILASAEKHPVCDAAIEAGAALGLKPTQDMNEPNDDPRVGYMPVTAKDGRRMSSARAFLKPALKRGNITVMTHMDVDRIDFEGKRAVGVSGRKHGRAFSYRANREVIVSAGALNSPKLLQLSGVGAGAHLQSLGIPVVHDSPEVGQNLREHFAMRVQYRLSQPLSHNQQLSGVMLVMNAIKYVLFRKGVMTVPAYEIGALMKSSPDVAHNDIFIQLSPFSMLFDGSKILLEKEPGIQFLLYQLYPKSRGSVAIASADADKAPVLKPNYFAEEEDRRAGVAAFRYTRQLAETKPLSDFIKSEAVPRPSQTDEQIIGRFERSGFGGAHAVGTCSLGTVLDGRARVQGVSGLRVVDCSMFPEIPGGGTNAPVMGMAWRTADLILEDQKVA